jgi:hypothetical protein
MEYVVEHACISDQPMHDASALPSAHEPTHIRNLGIEVQSFPQGSVSRCGLLAL